MVNFTFLLLELILAYQLADLSSSVESSCGKFYISTITANIVRSTGRSTPMIESSHGQFYISTIRANIGISTG